MAEKPLAEQDIPAVPSAIGREWPRQATKHTRKNKIRAKKTVLIAIICALTATSAVFGQHTQSITFSGPSAWVPGTTVSLDVFLTFSGYNAYGLSDWLEVSNAIAPYISITNVQSFTFLNPDQYTYPILFTLGGSSGYMGEAPDLGGTDNPPTFVVPGTYHVSTITLSLAANAPNVSFTLRTTSQTPRISEVTDTDFGDNNIIPPGMFIVSIIPEPSTLALLSFAAVGALVYRRRNR